MLGTLILWFGWFGFNPGSTLSVDFGGFGFFAYVATTTNIAAAAGAVTGIGVAWVKLGKPDISMMLNGALGALVAITAASGFVAPWAAIVIGIGSGFIAVFGVIFVERIGIDDPIGAVAVHGMSGVWGTLATGLFAVPLLAKNLATGTGGLVYTGSFHQLGVQALGLVAVGVFTFTTSFGRSACMHKLWGIRVEEHVGDGGPRRLTSTACGAIPSSTSRSPAATAPSPTAHLGQGRGSTRPRSPLPRRRWTERGGDAAPLTAGDGREKEDLRGRRHGRLEAARTAGCRSPSTKTLR